MTTRALSPASAAASTVAISVTVERHHLVRERTFDRAALIHVANELLDILGLHAEHATGRLTLHLNSGGIGAVQFEERAELTADPAQWQQP